MNPEEAFVKIVNLRKEIDYHSYLYFLKSEPEITDFEFDKLRRNWNSWKMKILSLMISIHQQKE
jgi:NAD-dependent DNA ligase